MQVEKQAAELLLGRGIKVEIKKPWFWRPLGKSKQIYILKSPTPATLLFIASIFCEVPELQKERLYDIVSLYKSHGNTVIKIVAAAITGSHKETKAFKRACKQLEREMSFKEVAMLYQITMLQGGFEDFMNTITFIKQTRITKPMNVSQKEMS